MLGKNQELLSIAAEKLNKSMLKKRQVVIIKKWSELGNELGNELGGELRNELRGELRNELRNEPWSELGSELGNELGNELRNELRNELWNELRNELWCSTWEFFETNWVLFIHEFYPQLKVFQKNKNKIEALKAIAEAGNCYIWLSKTKMYVLPFPEVHLLDKKLHNDKGYALKFADKETYWLNGIKFDYDFWHRLICHVANAKEILNLSNIEQRMAALKYYGSDKLLKELKSEIIDKMQPDYELHRIDNVFSQPAYFLKYSCPSTGRIYVSGIDLQVGKLNDVASALAWKFGLNKNEYKLTGES